MDNFVVIMLTSNNCPHCLAAVRDGSWKTLHDAVAATGIEVIEVSVPDITRIAKENYHPHLFDIVWAFPSTALFTKASWKDWTRPLEGLNISYLKSQPNNVASELRRLTAITYPRTYMVNIMGQMIPIPKYRKVTIKSKNTA